MVKNLVIVDLGSNSTRMSIVKVNGRNFKEIKRVKKNTRISEGMGKSKLLTQNAMWRTVAVLKDFKKLYKQYPNIEVKAITTAAVRQAKNQKEFLSLVKKQTGMKIEVLSGINEAYYDYLGVHDSIKLKNYLIVDIGGASCEIIQVANHKQKELVSIPFGAVNLSERFKLNNKVSAKNLFASQIYVYKRLCNLPWLRRLNLLPIILLGGANRALIKIHQNNQNNLQHKMQGYQLKPNDIFKIYQNLISVDNKQRSNIEGLEKERADIIIGGLLPLVEIIKMVNSKYVIFSESGVREGIINEYLKNGR